MSGTARRLAVGLVAVALIAGACGSSGNKTGASGETSTTAPTPQGAPIKLGVIVTTSGAGNHFPEIPVGARAAANAINAAGGVKDPAGGPNHPIEIDVCDDAFDPSHSASCARQMVSDKVLALVGNVSANGDVYAPIVYAAGIPLVGIQPNSGSESLNELSYPISGGSVVMLLSNVAFLAKQGVTKLTVEHVQNAAADFLVSTLKKKAASLGMTVVNDVPAPPDAPDLTPYAARLTAAGSQGAVLVEASDRIARFITALGQAGVSLEKFKIVGQLNPSALATLGATADGYYGVDSGFPVDDTANAGIKRFAKEYAAVKGGPGPSTFALQAWVDVHVIAETLIPKMAALDSAALINAMKTIGPINRPEWTPWDWSQPVEAVPGLKLRAFSNKVLYSKADNGRYRPLTPTFTSYL